MQAARIQLEMLKQTREAERQQAERTVEEEDVDFPENGELVGTAADLVLHMLDKVKSQHGRVKALKWILLEKGHADDGVLVRCLAQMDCMNGLKVYNSDFQELADLPSWSHLRTMLAAPVLDSPPRPVNPPRDELLTPASKNIGLEEQTPPTVPKPNTLQATTQEEGAARTQEDAATTQEEGAARTQEDAAGTRASTGKGAASTQASTGEGAASTQEGAAAKEAHTQEGAAANRRAPAKRPRKGARKSLGDNAAFVLGQVQKQNAPSATSVNAPSLDGEYEGHVPQMQKGSKRKASQVAERSGRRARGRQGQTENNSEDDGAADADGEGEAGSGLPVRRRRTAKDRYSPSPP
eukprot:2343324-Rhodomonas_salina.1